MPRESTSPPATRASRSIAAANIARDALRARFRLDGGRAIEAINLPAQRHADRHLARLSGRFRLKRPASTCVFSIPIRATHVSGPGLRDAWIHAGGSSEHTYNTDTRFKESQ